MVVSGPFTDWWTGVRFPPAPRSPRHICPAQGIRASAASGCRTRGGRGARRSWSRDVGPSATLRGDHCLRSPPVDRHVALVEMWPPTADTDTDESRAPFEFNLRLRCRGNAGRVRSGHGPADKSDDRASPPHPTTRQEPALSRRINPRCAGADGSAPSSTLISAEQYH